MKYSDYMKKKKEEEGKKKESRVSISNNLGYGQYKVAQKFGIDTLSSDLDTLSKTLDSVQKGWQSEETMKNTLSSIQGMYDRLGKYQEYQKQYGGTDLSELHSAYKGVLDDWDTLASKYKGYKDADAYNNAVKQTEAMKTADIGTLESEISSLEELEKEAKKHNSNVERLKGLKQTAESRSFTLKGKDFMGAEIKSAEDELNALLKDNGYNSYDELAKALGEKKVYKTNAERMQNVIKLSSVGDINSENYDKDYDKYVESGKSIPTDEVGTSKRMKSYGKGRPANTPKVNDALREVALAFERKQNGETSATSDNYYDKGAIFDLMTDEEFKNFYYYLGKDKEDGGNRTQEYVDAITESLNERRSKDIAKMVEEKPWGELGFALETGLDQWSSGMQANSSDKDYIPTSPIQYASGMVRENVEEDYGKFARTMYDLGVTGANQLPSILVSTALGAATGGVGAGIGAKVLSGMSKGAGLLTMGASARGNAYQEMLNLGYDKDQANTYANLVSASEMGLQALLGGISKLGGTSAKIAKKVSQIDNGLARFAIQYPLSMVSEGAEEGLQEILTPMFKNIAAGYDTGEKIDLGEVAYSTLLGGLMGGVFEGPGLAINSVTEHYQNKALGQDIKANERVSDVFALADNPEIASAYEAYTRYANKGITADNVSDVKLGRLANMVKSDNVEILNSKKSTSEQKTEALKRLSEFSLLGTENTVAKEKKKLNVGEETVVAESGETVDIKNLRAKGKDIFVATENGEISVEEMTFTDKDADLVSMARIIAREDGADVANLFINQYDGETDVDAYANQFNLTMAYAKNNYSFNEILNKKGNLSAEQVNAIYQETRIKADKERAEHIKKLNKEMADKGFYKGIIDESVIDYNNTSAEGKVNWNSLTGRQREAVTFIKGFAQATGMNLTFVANNSKYNGKYDRATNTITINLDKGGFDAIKNIHETIIPTMSHETTHWMKEKSPELWRNLNEIVFSTLTEHYNSNTEQAIKDKVVLLDMLEPHMKHTEEDAKGRTITEEDLIRAEMNRKGKSEDVSREEIIARACEDMLKMSEQGRKIFFSLSEEEQKTLVGKIKSLINDLLNWVNDLLNSYEATSTEARIMREYKEQLQKASKVWDEMLKKSVEANQSLEKSGAYNHDAELANVGLQFDAESGSIAPTTLLSEKTWTESEYVQNREVAINAIVKALDVSEEDASRYIDNINSIARMIADDRERLDYEPNIDENASALKTNKEYKWTVDMSTLCAKRLLYTGTFDAIQKKLPNTVFNSEEMLELRSMMMKRGREVACGICYVESTRRELGPITAEFIERYKLAQKNGTPISKINSAGKEVILQEKGTKRNFYTEDGYVPTLAELNTTDIDLVKRDHPEVYAAYLAFMKSRGQAIPKLLETRTEYKGEILKHFSNKSAVKSRNDAGGLRVQSFSDFEVAHLIDMMQIVLDMSRVGLMSQAYTKVPAFADVFGNTGMKINLSLIAKDSGLDADGNLIFDDVEGMPHKEAFRLRDKYSKNVGTILVGKNDAHIVKALADSRIDFVIPFHKSFWKESLYEALGLTGYEDYTDTQNEKPFDKDRKIKNFQPSEYWDYSKSGEENAKTYLKMCAEDGRIPKFPQFQNLDGYWKLLIDFKMYDNDGVGSPQTEVKPNFSMDEANAIMNDYKGGHKTFPVAQDVVDDFVKKYEGRNDILYSEKVTDISEDEYKNMKKHFGVTGNFNVAGYMLKNGSLLDFSGKHWGDSTSRTRQVDHREISEVLPSENNGIDSMVNMISNGNIRLMPEVGGINLAVAPSKNQRVVLRRYIEYMSRTEGIIVDIDAVGGDTIKSFTYDKGVSADRVIRDIDNYFKGGTQSELMRFHTAEGDGVLYDEKDYPIDKEIEEMVQNAIINRKSKMHSFGIISSYLNRAINRLALKTNDDSYRGKYTGGKHQFSDDGIKHSLAEHGDLLREALRAQLPMTPTDIARHLSAVKNNKYPKDVLASRTNRGNASIVTIYEVNGYTLYAEEIKKPLGQNAPSDLIGHTMYKAPTLATAAALTTSARALPKRQSMVLCEYHTTNSNNLSRGNFVADTNGNPAKLYYVHQNNNPKVDTVLGGLIALSSDSSNFTDKSTSFEEGYVVCKKPFHITQENRVFSNSETDVAERINELKKQGYDCFIFDKVVGDNYMVAVVNKAQIIKDEPNVVYSEKDSEGNTLSEGQIEFFKDSKVRDENGNLLVCYHGTDAEFSVFNYDFISQDNKLGLGFYFMAGKKLQFSYKYPLSVYLNIKNPITDTSRTFSKEAVTKLCNKLGIAFEYDSNDYDLSVYEKLSYDYKGEAKTFLENVIRILGVDGILSKDRNVAVAFDSNQIKLTSNTNPTESDDIRYSEKEQGIYDTMGETERIENENAKLNVDAGNLKNILGTEEIANRKFLNIANYLKKISGSSMDSAILGKMIKTVYTSMQSSDALTWESIDAQTRKIAESVMTNDMGVSSDYFKRVMFEIRKDKISLSEEQRARMEERFGNYGNFHKYVFGRVNVTKDGVPLEKAWGTWAKKYPSLFDANVSGAEQIDALVEAVDALKATSSIMGEYEHQEAIRHLSTEIYNQFWNIATDSSTVENAESYRKEHKAMMEELRKDYEKRQKDLVAHPVGETTLKYESLLRKVKETKRKEIARAKEHGREMLAGYKENAERKSKIQSITSNALSLNEYLLKNSKDKHIPEIMREPVTALLQAIDFSSKRLLEGGEPTQKDISLSKALGKVKDMMVKATNAHEELVELYGHGLDEDIEKMVDNVDTIMRQIGDNEFVINRMSLADLQTLDKMVKTIRHAVNKLNKFHTVNHAKGLVHLSQESMTYLNSLGKGKIHDGLRGKTEKLLNWNNALPYYAFKRFGSGGIKVYEALQDGWDKFAFNTKQILDYANEAYTSKEVKEWSEDVRTFKILIPADEDTMASADYVPQYQEVQFTIPQIMSMYCLYKREQARGHLFKGGVRVADFKDAKGNIVSQSEGIIFTEKDISTIFGALTGRQKAVADRLQEFMNTVTTDWGNEVSMARFGYKAFGEENYFPIQSDDNNLAVNDATEQVNSLFRLLNMSFTKSTVEKANNRIVISDIFDVFAQHTSDMAKYNALALPVLDAFKWYNYTEKQDIAEGTFKTKSVKQSIENAFGRDGKSYFTTFLKDINGSQETDREQLTKSFMRNYKIASVGANLRVIALQPTSYVRASAVIDNKYLTQALGHKPKIAKAEEHCGIALWKSMGYYDTNIQRGLEAQIKHADTWKDKAVEWSMKGAEVADKITWGYLWNACELEIRDTRRDLKVGSKEFYDAIGKRLREVIYATQVVDSTMTRSQMMRSTKMHDQVMTNFASEPTLSYNMLQDAYMEFSLDARRTSKKEAWKKHRGRMGRILYAYTMTNAVAALVESAFDAFREDDDEEMDMITFMKLYLSNFASDMSITGKIPYIKEIHSLIKGYSVSRSELAWMESSYKAVTGIYKNLQGKGKPITTIKNSIKTISYLSSLPFYNMYRDTMALLNKLDLFTEEELNEMFEDFFLYGILGEDE